MIELTPSSSLAPQCDNAAICSVDDTVVVSLQGSFLLEQWGNVQALMHHREAKDPQWIAVVR